MNRIDKFKIMEVLVNIKLDSLDIEVTGHSPDGRSFIPT